MHELDRILEADDVEAAMRVQMIDHRRECRRLAGAGRTGDEHHALVQIAETGDDGRKVQAVERRDLRRNVAERLADAGRLAVQVLAKAAAALGNIGDVEIVAGAKSLALAPGE